MAHEHDSSDSDHSHDTCETSGKYTQYIQSHLERLKSKCEGFTACIEQLLLDESPLLVLKGEDISLNKTCGLVYKKGSQGYYTLNGKCAVHERNDIRDDIEQHLKDAMSERDWAKVRRCLSNNYGDKERSNFVDEICGLASKEKELCNKYDIHRKVESFFNEQIQHMKCTCASLSQGHDHGTPIAAIAGAAVGGLVFLVLLAVLCFCCYKRRKSKKKKKSPNVIYLPAPNADNHPVYQEVFDDRPYQSHGFHIPSSNPPSLPMRYTSQPKGKGKQEEEPAYLEPMEVTQRGSYRPALPRRGQPTSNPNYDAPPEYSEHDTEKKSPGSKEEPGYFQPLPDPPSSPTETDDPGYDKLQGHLRASQHRTPPEGYESVEEARSSIPLEEAPRPVIPVEDIPLGPVPAARTKKEDRQTESHYFLLEEGSMKKHSEV
ncbi:hypothetical protein PoB_004506700 [Plakobranchus ocellatus]|uniref:Epidermal growth factor receptor-like transmembrane-juxtamembrane segment domain-containing protein n=1 Tax=Plakobranchus ocellatus TaxID=259542 RepID=A0AAV4BGP7_9GAST|nr:hypothetical protein PoB_004506700 [Plakobranchus ocellatus]